MTTATVAPRARLEKNDKFVDDGSLESVALLLRNLAAKCHARVQAMGLGMDFDDVHQEMHMGYLQAKRYWRPEGGARFSTYCTYACLRGFNAAIKKMERDRAELGMSSYNDIVFNLDGEECDPLERLHSTECDEMDLPEARLVKREALAENLRSLSPGARRLVAGLMASERRSETNLQKPPKLREIALRYQVTGPELVQVKQELLKKFGVTWQ